MSDPLSPAGILDRAADIIVRNGWHRDDFYLQVGIDGQPGAYRRGVARKDPRQCPVCAGGAINIAAGFDPDGDEVYEPRGYHADAIGAFVRHVDPGFDPTGDVSRPYAAIGAWNDAPGRTLEQVVAELRACAAGLRAGGQQ